MINKIKGIAYALMTLLSLIMLSFGNKEEPINDNISLWVLFALINFFYWGGKAFVAFISSILLIDGNNDYRNNDRGKKTYNYDFNNIPHEHTKYIPSTSPTHNAEDEIYNKIQIQSGVHIISVNNSKHEK